MSIVGCVLTWLITDWVGIRRMVDTLESRVSTPGLLSVPRTKSGVLAIAVSESLRYSGVCTQS